MRLFFKFDASLPIGSFPLTVSRTSYSRYQATRLALCVLVIIINTHRWFVSFLTHWGRVTHICVGNLTIIGPDNGLPPGRRQAIIWTNAGILLIGPWGTNFSEILIGIHTFSFKKINLKMSSAKWRPFCLGLNVLNVFKISLMNNWHISLKQDSVEFEWYLVNFRNVDLLLCFRCNVRWPYRIFSVQHILPNVAPIWLIGPSEILMWFWKCNIQPCLTDWYLQIFLW